MPTSLYSALHGITISDGQTAIGTLKDLLVDDKSWTVRHIVAQTGSWYSRRTKIVPAEAIRSLDGNSRSLAVNWDPNQWTRLNAVGRGATGENAAPWAHEGPNEGNRKSYPAAHLANTAAYQESPSVHGSIGAWMSTPHLASGVCDEEEEVYGIALRHNQAFRDTPSWRSIHDILGYEVKANDGFAGSIADVMLEEHGSCWRMSALVIRHGMWPSQKCVLLHPENVGWISWEEQCVSVGLSREQIQESPPFSPSRGWQQAPSSFSLGK